MSASELPVEASRRACILLKIRRFDEKLIMKESANDQDSVTQCRDGDEEDSIRIAMGRRS
jgi:hypothetical protein